MLTNKELLYILISISGIITFLLSVIALVIWKEIEKIRAIRHDHEKNLVSLDGRTQIIQMDMQLIKERVDRNTRQMDLLLGNWDNPILQRLRQDQGYERAKTNIQGG